MFNEALGHTQTMANAKGVAHGATAYRLLLRGAPSVERCEGNRRSRLALGRRAMPLVAYVAIEGGAERARLAALLYPDSNEETARRNLRRLLFSLRDQFPGLLEDDAETVRLSPGVMVVLGADDAAEADGPTSTAPGLLGDTHHDDLPEFAAWLERQRELQQRHSSESLAARAEQHERAGELAQALVLAQQLSASAPHSEHALRRVMRLHYLRGDASAAIAAFEQSERWLKDELSARPSQETLTLLATIESAQAVVPAPVRSPIPASVMRPPRLVGRSTELQAMRAAWRASRAFLLLGEAGLGKTRLLGELAAEHDGALHVQARPGDAGIPYATLARALRALVERAPQVLDKAPRHEIVRVLPEVGDAPAAAREGQRLVLQRALAALLERAHPAGVSALMLDDLHFADDASLEMVQALAAQEPALPLAWGFAQRPGEGGAAAVALRDGLTEVHRLETIVIAPLGLAQMTELIESLGLAQLDAPRLASTLTRHSGGNPLFALETLKQGLIEQLDFDATPLPRPASIGALIERRLHSLPESTLALARVAAVAGVDFSIALAETVLGRRAVELASAWQALEQAHVLRDNAFAHDLVQDAVLRTLPAAVERHLHGAVAQYLEGGQFEPARIAAHWEAAACWQRAGECYREAAQRANYAARHREEAELLRHAVDCFERCDNAQGRFDAMSARVDALAQSNFGELALQEAGRLTEYAATDAQRVAAIRALVELKAHRGEHESAIDTAQEGLRIARAIGATAEAVRISCPLSGCLCLRMRGDEAIQLLRPLQAWVQEQPDDLLKIEFLEYLAMALDTVGRPSQAIEVREQALRAARAVGHRSKLGQSLSNVAVSYTKMGNPRRAREYSEQAVAMIRDDPGATGQSLSTIATLGRNCGDDAHYADALRLLKEALSGFEAAGTEFWIRVVQGWLAAVHAHLGQLARAQALLREDDRCLPGWLRASRRLVLVNCALDDGRPARGLIDEALGCVAPDERLYSAPVRLAALRIAAPSDALPELQAIEAEESSRQRWGLVLEARICRADTLRRLGRHTAAIAAVDAAFELMTDYSPFATYRPVVWLLAHRVFVEAGAPERLRAVLRDASDWIVFHALPRVPPEFRDSFLNRNPVNRELIRLARRERLLPI
jgi:predicted ATPase/DNA-binding SARP family transcriptional activator